MWTTCTAETDDSGAESKQHESSCLPRELTRRILCLQQHFGRIFSADALWNVPLRTDTTEGSELAEWVACQSAVPQQQTCSSVQHWSRPNSPCHSARGSLQSYFTWKRQREQLRWRRGLAVSTFNPECDVKTLHESQSNVKNLVGALLSSLNPHHKVQTEQKTFASRKDALKRHKRVI